MNFKAIKLLSRAVNFVNFYLSLKQRYKLFIYLLVSPEIVLIPAVIGIVIRN